MLNQGNEQDHNLNYELRFFEDHIYFRNAQSVNLEPAIRVFYVLKGSVSVNGKTISEGEGISATEKVELLIGDDVTEMVRWELVKRGTSKTDLQAGFGDSANSYGQSLNKRSDFIAVTDSEIGIRLDTVTFPPGTCAYRHIHASCGIRYIVKGNLEINTDEGLYLMEQGQAWFEAVNSPVVAIANEEVETQFVRMMVLPVAYHGKLTISYIDPADDDKPRENKNNRLLDEIIQLG